MVDLDRLERVLVAAALDRWPLTYGQVLAYFERRVTRITVGALCRDLGRLEQAREAQRLPELACLVVRKADRLPGEGYFASLREEGTYAGPSQGPEAEACLRRRQEAAFGWAAEAERRRTDEAAAAAETSVSLSGRPGRPTTRGPCRTS